MKIASIVGARPNFIKLAPYKNTIIKAAREFEHSKGQRDVFGSGDASQRIVSKIVFCGADDI